MQENAKNNIKIYHEKINIISVNFTSIFCVGVVVMFGKTMFIICSSNYNYYIMRKNPELKIYKTYTIHLLGKDTTIEYVCDELNLWRPEKIYNDLVAVGLADTEAFSAYINYFKIYGYKYGKDVYFKQKDFPEPKYRKFLRKYSELYVSLNYAFRLQKAVDLIFNEILKMHLLYSSKKQLDAFIELLAEKFNAQRKN